MLISFITNTQSALAVPCTVLGERHCRIGFGGPWRVMVCEEMPDGTNEWVWYACGDAAICKDGYCICANQCNYEEQKICKWTAYISVMVCKRTPQGCLYLTSTPCLRPPGCPSRQLCCKDGDCFGCNEYNVCVGTTWREFRCDVTGWTGCTKYVDYLNHPLCAAPPLTTTEGLIFTNQGDPIACITQDGDINLEGKLFPNNAGNGRFKIKTEDGTIVASVDTVGNLYIGGIQQLESPGNTGFLVQNNGVTKVQIDSSGDLRLTGSVNQEVEVE